MSQATGTVVTIDKRTDSTQRHPVWQHIITYVAVTADTTATIALPIEGILQRIIYKRPDLANNDLTSTVTIADAGDNTIFTSPSGLAENDTSIYSLSEPLTGVCDVLITFNEQVDSAGTFVITLRGV